MSMPSLLMFTRDIQSKVSRICDCTFGLKGTMEKVKYQYRPYDKIKRVRLRAVNFFKSQLKDDYVFVNHDPNKARVSQKEDGVFAVTVPVIARARKSADAPGMPSASVTIGTARHNRYLTNASIRKTSLGERPERSPGGYRQRRKVAQGDRRDDADFRSVRRHPFRAPFRCRHFPTSLAAWRIA